MKVYISKYRDHWYSPYTFLEKVVYRREIDYDDPTVEKWVNRLEPISKAIQWFLDKVHPRIEYVKIDPADTWSMDHTLALIVLPMLKQLKATKHGSPMVDLEDVPPHLRTTSTEDWDQQMTFDFYHEQDKDLHYKGIHDRWEWVLDEMIFAFEKLNDDSWDDEFSSGEHDMKSVPCAWDENGKPTLYTFVKGPNDTYKCDYEGIRAVNERINNGLMLFGKYFRGLWD